MKNCRSNSVAAIVIVLVIGRPEIPSCAANNVREEQAVERLVAAAEKGDIAIVKALIIEGINLDQQDKDARTALRKAAASNQTEVVRLLIIRDGQRTRMTGRFRDRTIQGGHENRSPPNRPVVQSSCQRASPLRLAEMNGTETPDTNLRRQRRSQTRWRELLLENLSHLPPEQSAREASRPTFTVNR